MDPLVTSSHLDDPFAFEISKNSLAPPPRVEVSTFLRFPHEFGQPTPCCARSSRRADSLSIGGTSHDLLLERDRGTMILYKPNVKLDLRQRDPV
jgi:hypothetical protein